MWKDAKWVSVPREEIQEKKIYEGDMTGRFAYFICQASAAINSRLTLHITANSRYRLWINGEPVLSGPCKGDYYRHYYETVDVGGYLNAGENIVAVQVLYLDPDQADGQYEERSSIFGVVSRGGGHRLAVEGDILDEAGRRVDTLTTGRAKWRVWLDGSFYLKSDEITANLGGIKEEITFGPSPYMWKLSAHPEWKAAAAGPDVMKTDFMEKVGLSQLLPLTRREIPLLYELPDHFAMEMTPTGILENGTLTIAPGRCVELLLDAGVHKNGYMQYRFVGGKGRRISFTYFEKFVKKGMTIARDDRSLGEITGLTDTVTLEEDRELIYEPFWYRTFRFLRIRISAGETQITMDAPVFFRTGYPLKAQSQVSSSEKWVGDVYEICQRTLENCMMETYMDCPYYEQMQFPMDTRLQMLFNYAAGTDMALAKKVLTDYHCGMQPCGLIPGKYPSAYLQVISTFSLHYIFLMAEYYEQTGDLPPLMEYRPDVDRILGYYDRKRNAAGLVEDLGFWEFVDWQKAWADTAGCPRARKAGPSTIINLMYAYALLLGAKIYSYTGRPATAAEYMDRRDQILDRIQKYCWDFQAGMYREGPEYTEFSQHAQSWAVLNGMDGTEGGWRREKGMDQTEGGWRAKAGPDAAGVPGNGMAADGWQAHLMGMRNIMLRSVSKDAPKPGCKPVIPVSFSTAYEFFRAMEKAGCYGETKDSMMRWAHLVDLHCTTCPEEPENGRSECHAWSALPMYELLRCVAGIRSDGAGWPRVVVAPHLDDVPDLRGKAWTPKGAILFEYRQEKGRWVYELTLPTGLNGSFVYPDGRRADLREGKNRLS